MRHEEPDPDPFPPVPLNVWGEVYNGRWANLRPIQRIEFIVEVFFLVSFFSVCVYAGYVDRGSLVPFVIGFLVVGIGLAAFFYLLTRSIH